MRSVCFACLCTAALAPSVLAAPQDPILPAGFVSERAGNDWNQPVGLAFLDATRLLVAERDGRVWLVEDDSKRNVVVDVSAETLTNGDRGLLGLAIDRDFAANGWIYLLLVVDPTGGGGNDAHAFCRLLRYEARFDAEGELHAGPESRLELLGDRWETGIPSCHLSHSIGSVRQLSDGSLVVSTGDGAHYDLTDSGGFDPGCFGAGRFSADQDMGAFRSQVLDSYSGKILRVDRTTGLGLPDNPYYTGDPDSIASRVYALGLRNPFRFTLLPGSGPREVLFVSDVGWNRAEEINVVLGGENFGWPCVEGRRLQMEYQGNDPLGLCAGLGAVQTPPLLAWSHLAPGEVGFTGNSATGVAVYEGGGYPPLYAGRLFFMDFGAGWLRAAELDENLAVTDVRLFGRQMGAPVDLAVDPLTGDLVYAALSPPRVARIRYVGSNLPPIAVATAEPAWGPAPLEVSLNALGSQDPEGEALTYAWDLGDGESSTLAALVHTYPDPTRNYTVRLTVTDSHGYRASAQLLVTPGNTPPEILEIVQPLDGQLYQSGEPLRVSGRSTDAEDGPDAGLEWSLDLVHGHHVHPGWAAAAGPEGILYPDTHGDGDLSFRLTLRTTDTRGLSDEHSVSIFDEDSTPQAHLVDLADDTPRVGQRIAPVGHIDFARRQIDGRLPSLTWDWGDGSTDTFLDAEHHADTTPTHVYTRAGNRKLRLVARLDEHEHVETVLLRVGPPRAAVAVFVPTLQERWVPREEQEQIAATLSSGLADAADHVAIFRLGEGSELVAWMEAFFDDGLADVLVLIDFVPAALFAGEADGSLAERWLERGNAIVWTGQTPFFEALDDAGGVVPTGAGSQGAEHVLDGLPGLCLGAGTQTPTELAALEVPSLGSFFGVRSLRTTRLGTEWRVHKTYADDGAGASDAVVIQHASGGIYAQVLCTDAGGLARPSVVTELVRANLGSNRLRSGSGPGLAPRQQ